MFWLLLNILLIRTCGLTFTSSSLFILLHACGIQNVLVACGCCSECCSPSVFADDCIQTPCGNQNITPWALSFVSSHCLWAAAATQTTSHVLISVKFTMKTQSHLYLLDDGLQALARSQLTAASCMENCVERGIRGVERGIRYIENCNPRYRAWHPHHRTWHPRHRKSSSAA